MKGKAKLVRSERDGTYKVFARTYFWQKWEELLDNDGNPLTFKTFKEFGDTTKIESFGKITVTYDDYQGM